MCFLFELYFMNTISASIPLHCSSVCRWVTLNREVIFFHTQSEILNGKGLQISINLPQTSYSEVPLFSIWMFLWKSIFTPNHWERVKDMIEVHRGLTYQCGFDLFITVVFICFTSHKSSIMLIIKLGIIGLSKSTHIHSFNLFCSATKAL